MPYADPASDESAWGIEPDVRVKNVLDTGIGNCATKSRALARILQREGVPYQIVWIMNNEEARSGVGHTVVRCPVVVDGIEGIGLIDMLEGGIPLSDGRMIDVSDLTRHEPIPEFRLNALTRHDDRNSEFYGVALKHSVIAVSQGADFNRYFNFLKLAYVDTGIPRLEKLVYTVGTTVLGVYPMVLITSDEIARFDTWFRVEVAIARTMIWAVRILMFMLLVDMGIYVSRLAVRISIRPKATTPAN